MYNSQEIAKKIREAANEKNIKIGTMFSDLDVSRNTLHNMNTSMPTVQTLAKIAEYLGCTLDDLCGTAKKEEAPETVRSRMIQRINSLTDEQLEHLLNLFDSLLA